MADNILMQLKAGRQYLKTDFKIHTASESLAQITAECSPSVGQSKSTTVSANISIS